MFGDLLRKISKPSAKGRVWQVFSLIMLLLVVGAIFDAGDYYNKGADVLSSKTGNFIKLPHIKSSPYRLGLDLQGGTHLVYDADVSAIAESDRASAVESARDVIQQRVNVFGVSEPVIQINKTVDGGYKIIAELAGVKDVNEAIKMIGETPILEFKEQATEVSTEEKKKLDDYNKESAKKAKEVLGKALSGGDFSALAKEYSQDEKTKDNGGNLDWISNETRPDLVDAIKNMKSGEISKQLVNTSEGYQVVKLDDKRTRKDQLNNETVKEAKASHILICYKDSEGCKSALSKEDAYKKIKEIKDKVTKDNFKDLAKQYSDEPGAKDSGGELGWFGKGQMVKPFEDAVFSQSKGVVPFVVETKFGYHLIFKEDERDAQEYKISRILFPIVSEQSLLGYSENWKNTELTGKNLKRAVVSYNSIDYTPEVVLEFDDEGSKKFEEITARNTGKKVAIFLDGYKLSEPTVNEKISGGRASISGRFNQKEANLLAKRLNAGALPIPIKLISQETVGASLGKASVISSLKAGLIGLGLVVVFMVVYYRLLGVLSIMSLLVYGVFLLAVFKAWSVTLTLSGLAGFIMSVGVAVDANVLIFERIKEELKDGQPLSLAIEDGIRRAWPSIRDGNFSTMITCLLLMMFFKGMIRGFAVTLLLGVIVSVFCALVVTKNFLSLIIGDWLDKRRWLLGVSEKNSEKK